MTSPVTVVAVTAVALVTFVAASTWTEALRRGQLLVVPPVYGRFEPQFSIPAVIAAVVVLLVGGLGAGVAMRRSRIPAPVLLTGLFCFLLVFSGAVGLVRGDTTALYDSVLRAHLPERTGDPDYAGDVPLVQEFGVRGAVEAWPDLVPRMASAHSKTHPPGPVVLMTFLEERFPGRPLYHAYVLAAISALVVVPAWAMARAAFGDRAARIAGFLLVTAPGPVMLVFTSMDAVFTTFLAASAAMIAAAVHRRSVALAAGAGAVLGIVTFFTYAAVFVAVFGGLYAFVRLQVGTAAKILAGAAVGGTTVLGALYLLVGYDPLSAYAGVPPPYSTDFNYPYWLVATPALWLLFAGFSAAGLGVRELVARRPPLLITGVGPLLFFWSLPYAVTRLVPGEVERTWLFAYPFLMAAAGAYLASWSEDRKRPPTITIAALVMVSGVQAIVMEGLVYTYW